MAIVQISKIQVKTGNIADLPQLSPGEFGYATDSKQLFIGNDPNVVGPIPDNTEILTTDSGISAAGSTGEIQFNTNDHLDASPNLTWDNANSVLTANGEVSGQVVVAEIGLFLNANTISQVFQIPAGYNAMSAGPIDVTSQGNVIVPSGSTWTIV